MINIMWFINKNIALYPCEHMTIKSLNCLAFYKQTNDKYYVIYKQKHCIVSMWTYDYQEFESRFINANDKYYVIYKQKHCIVSMWYMTIMSLNRLFYKQTN